MVGGLTPDARPAAIASSTAAGPPDLQDERGPSVPTNQHPHQHPLVPCSKEKAAQFLQKGREATNDEYALYWLLVGLRTDPSDVKAYEDVLVRAKSLSKVKGKLPSNAADAIASAAEPDPYLRSFVSFAFRPEDPAYAVSSAERAAALNLIEPALFLAERAMQLLGGAEGKQSIPTYKRLAGVFQSCQSLDRAVKAAEAAHHLDRQNAEIAKLLKDLSALAYMGKGGLDKAGEGGFRNNLQDAEGQRRLHDQGRLNKDGQALDHDVEQAKEDFEAKPGEKPSFDAYIKALLNRRKGDDEDIAKKLLLDAFAATKDPSYRVRALNIEVEQRKRGLSELVEQFRSEPSNAELKERVQREKAALRAYEIKVREEQVKAEPTVSDHKCKLGELYIKVGRTDDAIVILQKVRGDLKNGSLASLWLGRAFLQKKWPDAAITVFKQAIDKAEKGQVGQNGEGQLLELKHGLAHALLDQAEKEQDSKLASEAQAAITAVIIEDLNFKDIQKLRARAEAFLERLKSRLIREEGGGGAKAAAGSE